MMANSVVYDVLSLDTRNTKKLYDGDFIDLTSETELQNCVVDDVEDDDDVVLVDNVPNVDKNNLEIPAVNNTFNQTSVNQINQTSVNQTNSQATIIPIINPINAGPSNSQRFLIPMNLINPGNYLIMNQTNESTIQSAIPNANNIQGNQSIKILDQVTVAPGSVVTKLNFKNTGGNITVEEMPAVIQSINGQSQNLLQNQIKCSTDTVQTEHKKVVNSSVIFSKEVKKLPDKVSKVSNIYPLNTQNTRAGSNANGTGGKNKQFGKVLPQSQQPFLVSPRSNSPHVKGTQNVHLKPSCSEMKNTEKERNISQQPSVQHNPSSLNVQQPNHGTYQIIPNSETQKNNAFLLPGQSRNRSISSVKKTVTLNPCSVTKVQTVNKIPQSNQNKNINQLRDKKNDMLLNKKSGTVEATKVCNNMFPISAVMEPQQLQLFTNGENVDLADKTILVNINKDGKKSLIVFNTPPNAVNLPKQQIVHSSVSNTAQTITKETSNKEKQSPPTFNKVDMQQKENFVVRQNTQTGKAVSSRESLTKCHNNPNSQNQPHKTFAPKAEPALCKKENVSERSNVMKASTTCVSNNIQQRTDTILSNSPIRRTGSQPITAVKIVKVLNNKSDQQARNIPQQEPPYYLMYSALDDDKTVEIKEEVQTCSNDKDIEFVESDPLKESIFEDILIESPCVVTPVDITKILNEAKKPEIVVDRCENAKLKKDSLYQKGFTRREMRKPKCLKYLYETIISNEEKIKKLKRRVASYETNFINCRSDPNNFLPEVVKCETDENEEVTIEYSNLEEQLNAEIYETAAIPVISKVISEVNEQVAEFKMQSRSRKKTDKEDLKAKLAKPEAALKLIQKGLELIKSWSVETHLAKVSKSETTRTQRSGVSNNQKGRMTSVAERVQETSVRIRRTNRRQTTKKDFVCEPVKRGRGQRLSKQVETQKAKPVENNLKRGGRKRKVKDYDSSGDNDLFVVKKVDILNVKGKRARRR